MKQELLSQLTLNGISNDIELPIWIYKIENIVVQSRRYLKVYLFNRLYTDEAVNRIVFLHGEAEKTVDSFSTITDFNNPNAIGCILEIDLEDSTSDLKIKKEIINGKTYDASGKLVQFDNPNISEDKSSYLQKKKMIETYPDVKDDYWLCTCGRINGNGQKCICGKDVTSLKSVFDFDYDDNYIKDYIFANPIIFDLTKSFNENIDLYFNNFVKTYPNILIDKFKDKFDLSKEEEKYNDLLKAKEEKEKAETAAKKKRSVILALCGIALAAFLAVYFFVIAPTNKYNEAVSLYNNKEYMASLELFEELKNFKDSKDYAFNCKYSQALIYAADGNYDDSIELLEQIKDSNDAAMEKYKETKYNYAVLLSSKGNYDEAKDVFNSISGYKDSNDQIKMCRGPVVGDSVKMGDYKWTVIGKDTDGFLLLATNNLFKGPITMNWGTKVYTSFNETERNLILSDKIPDEFGTYNGLFLLSSTEFLKYKKNIPVVSRSWWLRNKTGYKIADWDIYYVVCGNDNPMGRGDGTTQYKVDGTEGELNGGGVTSIIDEVFFRPAVWVTY